MKLNCDMGESFGSWSMGMDHLVMPHIHMANIACGFHASDPEIMDRTVVLANDHGVTIGAHPSYPDLAGFGRRSMDCSPSEIRCMVIYQVSALMGICQVNNTKIHYVKPHGALYNDMMRDELIMQTMIEAVAALKLDLSLMIQATVRNDYYAEVAAKQGVSLLFEAFADRGYDDQGLLLPRSLPDAVYTDQAAILERVQHLAETGEIHAASGQVLRLNPDTLCVHGDNAESIKAVAAIRQVLDNV